MFRNLLATTALAALVATVAYAQQDPAQPAQPDPMQPGQTETMPQTTEPAAPSDQAAAPVKADGYLASNIMGESVYNGAGDAAENIGSVNDIVLDKDGKAQTLVVGVGGFLGIGQRNIAVEFTKLSWAEANGDRWLVYPTTKEELEAMPEFDRTPYDPVPPPAPDATSSIGGTAPPMTEPAPAEPAPAQ